MPNILINGGATPNFKILSQEAINAGKTFDNAGVLDLLFDGMSGGIYPGVYTSGVLYSSAGWSSYQIGNVFFGQIQVTRQYYTVYFDRVFNSPPQIIYALRPAGNTGWGITPRYAAVQNYTNGRGGTAVSAITYTDRAYFSVDFVTYLTIGTTNWDIAYIVFQS